MHLVGLQCEQAAITGSSRRRPRFKEGGCLPERELQRVARVVDQVGVWVVSGAHQRRVLAQAGQERLDASLRRVTCSLGLAWRRWRGGDLQRAALTKQGQSAQPGKGSLHNSRTPSHLQTFLKTRSQHQPQRVAHSLEVQRGQGHARGQGEGDAVLAQRRRVLGDGADVGQRDGVHLGAGMRRAE